MVEVVEIYYRIILAVLGFLLPMMALLLPKLGKRIAVQTVKKQTAQAQLEELKRQLSAQYEDAVERIKDPTLRATLQKAGEKYQKSTVRKFNSQIKSIQKSLRLYDSKATIKRLFFELIVSLIFVMAYELVRVDLYGLFRLPKEYHLYLGLFFLLLSVLIFADSTIVLWKLTCIIIEDNVENIPSDESNINPQTTETAT